MITDTACRPGVVSVTSGRTSGMGIRSALRLVREGEDMSAAAASLPVPAATGVLSPRARRVASPWSTTQLQQIVWSDVYGSTALLPPTRAEAITVPSVQAARKLLVGRIAGLPMVALAGNERLPVQPSFLYRTDGAVSPWHRLAWTVDDLIFHGWSLWRTVRGKDNAILTADRIPYEWWTVDQDGRILLTDPTTGEQHHPNADEVLVIPGPDEGLLAYAGTTIRAARNVEQAWAGRVRNPIPVIDLHRTADSEMTDDEVDDMIADFATKRTDPNGAITSTPSDVEVRIYGDQATNYLIEARNAVRLDVANHTGLPAQALDGSLSTASLTYTTTEGKRSDIADALDYWMDPIAFRLSQDDVVPRGQRVRFDVTDISGPVTPTGLTVED